MSTKHDASAASTNTRPTILVTGGCGYIGSHTLTCLLQQNYNVVIVDNLINSSVVALDRVAEICQLNDADRSTRLQFYRVDVCDEPALRHVFEKYVDTPFAACIHFAGLKAVGESIQQPIRYYENNLIGTFVLLKLMDQFHCHHLVFSSSATVYGAAEVMPLTERAPVGSGITNAYGRSKYMIEEILRDFYNSKALNEKQTPHRWSIAILRYFNPVGAHPSGLIGEDPDGPPNNLMPYVAQVAVGRREYLTVFGNDYNTPDGTGVRDYLHVMDLAEGHLSALHYLASKDVGVYTFNLGTGHGYSVLDMINGMEKACGHEVKYIVGPRRPGDIASSYADATLAEQELGWKSTRSLEEMCQDLWCWQQKNPNGFQVASID